jgi:hypothetical protein
MILELNMNDLKEDQVDHFGRFLINIFTMNMGPWLRPRNNTEGVAEENGWVNYLIYFGKNRVSLISTYVLLLFTISFLMTDRF